MRKDICFIGIYYLRVHMTLWHRTYVDVIYNMLCRCIVFFSVFFSSYIFLLSHTLQRYMWDGEYSLCCYCRLLWDEDRALTSCQLGNWRVNVCMCLDLWYPCYTAKYGYGVWWCIYQMTFCIGTTIRANIVISYILLLYYRDIVGRATFFFCSQPPSIIPPYIFLPVPQPHEQHCVLLLVFTEDVLLGKSKLLVGISEALLPQPYYKTVFTFIQFVRA